MLGNSVADNSSVSPVFGRSVYLFMGSRWLSAAGDWLGVTAMGWFLSISLRGGPELYAGSRLLTALAVVVGSLLAGQLLQRFAAARILFLSCLAASAVSLSIAYLSSQSSETESERVWIVVAVLAASFTAGLTQSGRESSEQRYQAMLVPHSEQMALEYLWSILYYLARIGLGLVAGLMLADPARFGVPALFVLDAISFLLLGVAVILIKTPIKQRSEPQLAALGSLVQQLFSACKNYPAGILVVCRSSQLRLLMWLLFLIEGIGFTALILLPEIIAHDLQSGPAKSVPLYGGELSIEKLSSAEQFSDPPQSASFGYGLTVCISGIGGLVGILFHRWATREQAISETVLFSLGALLSPTGLLLASFCDSVLSLSVCYAIALLGWSWFIPPVRVFCRVHAQAPLVVAMLSLMLSGICRFSQVGLTVLLHSYFELSALSALRCCSGASLVLLIVTPILFGRGLLDLKRSIHQR